jgi:hypothetical protein
VSGTLSEVAIVAQIDPDDIYRGLNGNDEAIIAFVVELILASESSEVVDRLRERLIGWWEPDGDGVKEGS